MEISKGRRCPPPPGEGDGDGDSPMAQSTTSPTSPVLHSPSGSTSYGPFHRSKPEAHQAAQSRKVHFTFPASCNYSSIQPFIKKASEGSEQLDSSIKDLPQQTEEKVGCGEETESRLTICSSDLIFSQPRHRFKFLFHQRRIGCGKRRSPACCSSALNFPNFDPGSEFHLLSVLRF